MYGGYSCDADRARSSVRQARAAQDASRVRARSRRVAVRRPKANQDNVSPRQRDQLIRATPTLRFPLSASACAARASALRQYFPPPTNAETDESAERRCRLSAADLSRAGD